MWAIFTSFFSALTYLMTTLTHFWDPEVAFTLQLITTSAVSALRPTTHAATRLWPYSGRGWERS